jgi:hypothetical protein
MGTRIPTPVKESFEKNGFYIFSQPVIDSESIQKAVEGMDMLRAGVYDTGKPPPKSLWSPGDDLDSLCKIEQPQIANVAIATLIHSPEIGEWTAHVTGAKMIQVAGVQLLYKPPAVYDRSASTKVGWHRDWTYFRKHWEPGSLLLTAWVALSDVEAVSGPMKLVVGSHRWGETTGGDFFSQEISQDNFNVPSNRVWQEAPALMNPGGISLHDQHVLHGSSENLSDTPRRSLAIHVRTEKSRLIGGWREGLTSHIDDLSIAPIIYGKKVAAAFA